MLGVPVTVTIKLPEEKRRFLHGYTESFSLVSSDTEHFHYRAEITPWAGLLALSSHSRIFQAMTVPEILKAVFDEAGHHDYRSKLHRTYHRRETCTQYRESDLAFVSRLMEQEGISYYFEHHADKHVMVLCDQRIDYGPCPGYESIPFLPEGTDRPELERITEWEMAVRLRTEQVTFHDHDYTTPRAELMASAQAPVTERAIGHWFETPGYHSTTEEGEHFVRNRMEAEDCRRHECWGKARCAGLAVGTQIRLLHPPDERSDARFLLTATALRMEAAEYRSAMAEFAYDCECTVQAVPVEFVFRPLPVTPRPVIAGIQTAVVTGPANQNPKIPYVTPLGSVKVHFRWDVEGRENERSSGWVRVAQISAGNGYGSMFIPRIGNEVAVAFEHGDPDRPIIVGHLYNFVNRPPLPLPDFAQRCYINDDGGNALAFVPDQGAQSIILYSPTQETLQFIGASADAEAPTPPPSV